MISSEELSVADVDLLVQLWEYYGKKNEFEMHSCNWKNYSELIELSKAHPDIVEIYPNNELMDEKGQPAISFVKILPRGIKLIKKRPRENKRQVTINGKKIEIRSERASMILAPPIENLIIMARVWMNHLEILLRENHQGIASDARFDLYTLSNSGKIPTHTLDLPIRV